MSVNKTVADSVTGTTSANHETSSAKSNNPIPIADTENATVAGTENQGIDYTAPFGFAAIIAAGAVLAGFRYRRKKQDQNN